MVGYNYLIGLNGFGLLYQEPVTRINDPAKTYLENLDRINHIVTRHCARYGLTDEETEDFRSALHLKLLDQDYAVLRKHRGESNLKTYLASVIYHFFKDWRNAQLGKWRPTAAAKRLGDVAVLLERLIHRDEYRFDQACQIIQNNHALDISLKELEDIYEHLPMRTRRQNVGAEQLETLTSGDPDADHLLVHQESQQLQVKAMQAVSSVMKELDQQDRVLIKMHFGQGVSIAGIARAMGQNQRKLYGRIEKIKGSLKTVLAKVGIMKTDLGDFFD